jgi:peptide/nickel transport system ATP-binding protein
MSDEPVLEAVDVTKHFPVRSGPGRGGVVHAVDHVSLRLHPGRIVALVGESGSGKTTLARLLALFYPVTSGEIRLRGVPIDSRRRRNTREYYRTVQLIFQDPFGSLNSLHRVRYNLERALRIHGKARGRTELAERATELLDRVNLTPAGEFLDKFPHELSGGQRQRIVVARALAVQPAVLLGDEPISMLDVSIRLDVLNLLGKLRDEDGLALLYITHDIASARYLSDEINVMYAGQLVEGGPTELVIQHSAHPYTRLLLDSAPDPARSVGESGVTAFVEAGELGEPPSLINPPAGCRFHPRCPFVMEECRTRLPDRTELGSGHWTRCWLHQKGRADLLATKARGDGVP